VGLRVQSDLPADLEDLVRETIDSCFGVLVELGPGWLEGVYVRAVSLELSARKIPFETEKLIPIDYRARQLQRARLQTRNSQDCFVTVTNCFVSSWLKAVVITQFAGI
jgi:hypothetical protein